MSMDKGKEKGRQQALRIVLTLLTVLKWMLSRGRDDMLWMESISIVC
jgi:hypothetical protein